MTATTLQLTQFKIQKLQCIGGAGRASPYRITTYRGMNLGTIGQVMECAEEAGNADAFESHESGSIGRRVKNLLSNFRSAS